MCYRRHAPNATVQCAIHGWWCSTADPYLMAPMGKGWLLNGTFLLSFRCKPDAPDEVRITAAMWESAGMLWVKKGDRIGADCSGNC